MILADDPCIDNARTLFNVCAKRTKNAVLLQLPVRRNALLESVRHMIESMNCAVLLTSTSLSHTFERRNACRQGTRIISMPNINTDIFSRISKTNFEKTARLSQKVSDILTMAHDVNINSPNGTELHFTISKGRGFANTGLVREPGNFSSLPAGEACVLPDSGSCNGKLYVDCGMGIYEKEKLLFIIKEGRAVRIMGDQAARRLRSRLAKHGPNSRILAEFGIGTNDTALSHGYSFEDKKVKGAVHIAIGNNVSFGGHNDIPIHMDAVVYKPSVVIDGRHILHEGELLIV